MIVSLRLPADCLILLQQNNKTSGLRRLHQLPRIQISAKVLGLNKMAALYASEKLDILRVEEKTASFNQELDIAIAQLAPSVQSPTMLDFRLTVTRPLVLPKVRKVWVSGLGYASVIDTKDEMVKVCFYNLINIEINIGYRYILINVKNYRSSVRTTTSHSG